MANPLFSIITITFNAAETLPHTLRSVDAQNCKDYEHLIIDGASTDHTVAIASAALVTNNFHVARALALARRQGLTDVSAIAAPSDPLYLPNNMFREFFGLTKDFLMGNL